MQLSYLIDICVEEVSKLARLAKSVEVDMFDIDLWVMPGFSEVARFLSQCVLPSNSPGLAAMPNIRCPNCCKMFPNHTQLLQHMNQPCGHYVTGCLLTNPHSFSIPDLGADGDVGSSEDDNDNWQNIGPGFDGSGFKGGPDFMGETQMEPDSFIKWYPGASTNYGCGLSWPVPPGWSLVQRRAEGRRCSEP